MTLDLWELFEGWQETPTDMAAREIIGRDGQPALQLRVEMGLLQLQPTGRPDGGRPSGFPSALEHIRHELCLHARVETTDWRELQREISQLNYRRVAYSSLVDAAVEEEQTDAAERWLGAAIDDIEACLERLTLMRDHKAPSMSPELRSLLPTLVFNRARQRSQRWVLRGEHEHAIEEVDDGAAQLAIVLQQLDSNADPAEDAGVRFLQSLSARLRRQFNIDKTLQEQLAEAIENEDFEAAARLRDALSRRDQESEP